MTDMNAELKFLGHPKKAGITSRMSKRRQKLRDYVTHKINELIWNRLKNLSPPSADQRSTKAPNEYKSRQKTGKKSSE